MSTHSPVLPSPVDDCLDVVVIGAGQAGLAVASHLTERGLRLLVVDAAAEVGHSWRTRWDSLRLFTPAQYDGLPGAPFPAPADTYPTKDQVADFLADYAQRRQLPVLLGCRVERLERPAGADDRFVLHTSQGPLRARQVVVATGPFQQPVVPAIADGLPADVVQVHSAEYRNPDRLPAGPVLVVGAGNSGLQIAAELAATREVALAVGSRSPQLPQRFLGRDLFFWLTRLGVLTKSADSFLARRMRARGGDLVIGSSFAEVERRGVQLRPRLTKAGADGVTFADGSTYGPSSVVWATGFRNDYAWIDVPGVIDAEGQVRHDRGISEVPGLAFIGLPWQHSRGSALLGFVQHDAAWVAAKVLARAGSGATVRV